MVKNTKLCHKKRDFSGTDQVVAAALISKERCSPLGKQRRCGGNHERGECGHDKIEVNSACHWPNAMCVCCCFHGEKVKKVEKRFSSGIQVLITGACLKHKNNQCTARLQIFFGGGEVIIWAV
jgi:hypothetical protein